MEMFHITDVISVLGLPYPALGQTSYYVPCPCCDDGRSHSKHLNINIKKEVFRGPRCNVSGGIFDLYALYKGVPRNQVYRELVEKLGTPTSAARPKITTPRNIPQAAWCECPITDAESRHATYSALLEKLSLSNDHKQNLMRRGLSENDIVRLGYKTTPVVGMASIAKQLQSDGYYLAGVPGFYRTDSDTWTFVTEKRGILIPVRNTDGRIQGLQIRRDDAQKRKFRWFSSTDMKDGCKAEGWTHLVGKITPQVILTEGPMKADVINALSGLTVLAVPGVNALTHLRLTLEKLREKGVRKIQTAFDMDFCTNIHVRNGLDSLLRLLDEMGFRYGTYVWDPTYKGLDDYVWAHKYKKTGGG